MLLEHRNPSGCTKGEEENQVSTSIMELSAVISELIPRGVHSFLLTAAAGEETTKVLGDRWGEDVWKVTGLVKTSKAADF